MPLCPMCELEVPAFHKRSHVLPDWMYAECKDELHRSILLSLEGENAQLSQSGLYGSYWCPACETESNWPDDYACRVLTVRGRESKEGQRVKITPVAPKEGSDVPPYVHWTGLDQKTLSQFVQICVLRAHLYQLSQKKEPLLTEAEFKALRFTYRSKLIDDKTFPVFAYVEPDQAKYRTMIMPPYRSSLGGGKCIEFKGPGIVFYLVLEKTADNERTLEAFRLKESGEFYTLVRYYEQGATFKNALPKLSAILEKHPPSKFKPK